LTPSVPLIELVKSGLLEKISDSKSIYKQLTVEKLSDLISFRIII